MIQWFLRVVVFMLWCNGKFEIMRSISMNKLPTELLAIVYSDVMIVWLSARVHDYQRPSFSPMPSILGKVKKPRGYHSFLLSA